MIKNTILIAIFLVFFNFIICDDTIPGCMGYIKADPVINEYKL